MFKFSNVQACECSKAQIFKCSNVQIFQCSNFPMFQLSNDPMFQIFKCSNVSKFKSSTVKSSNAFNAALGPTKEGQYLLPGEGGKPADIYIPWHSGGKDAALTVINPLQAATVGQAAETPGHAIQVAHRRKMDKSWQPCQVATIRELFSCHLLWRVSVLGTSLPSQR